MNYNSLALGFVLIGIGCYTTVMRRRGPSRKMEAMKRAFGERAGVLLHWTCYTLLPLVYGVVAVVLGAQGKSFFQ